MPVSVACPSCKKKYTLPDKMLGKPVKCPACNAQFRIPAAKAGTKAAGQAKTIDPAQAAAQKKAQALKARQANELKQMGVEGGISKAPDVFAGAGAAAGTPDPLSNFVVEDFGFGEQDSSDIADEAKNEKPVDESMAAMYANPALANKAEKRTVRKLKQPQRAMTNEPWFLLTVVFVPLFLILMALSWFEVLPEGTSYTVAMIVTGLFSLATVAIWIWGMMLVYKTTPDILQLLLCIFVPFYIIYYLIVHWADMKSYGFALIASLLITPLGIAAIVMAGVELFS